jgi:hypothetical protein
MRCATNASPRKAFAESPTMLCVRQQITRTCVHGIRTGHRSSQMINTYRRTARTYAELGLGELAPMAEAIPELRVPFEKAQGTNTKGCRDRSTT